ncbi:3489_t:CDS:2 [Acaulospora colombiana]|uniref:3489_t:CDS:1 n=1 Tax=Acaulospora colombiana TaxID=27376 RepID=A0ACA9Q7L4_9GLOM|nr:3489_t:CDS:2 [Acaulospora colombiana]
MALSYASQHESSPWSPPRQETIFSLKVIEDCKFRVSFTGDDLNSLFARALKIREGTPYALLLEYNDRPLAFLPPTKLEPNDDPSSISEYPFQDVYDEISSPVLYGDECYGPHGFWVYDDARGHGQGTQMDFGDYEKTFRDA